MRNSWMFVLQRYVKKCFPKTDDKRTRHIFQIGGQVHSTLHFRSFPNGALFFKGRLLTSSWHTLKNSLLFWSFFQKSKQTFEVTLVLPWEKSGVKNFFNHLLLYTERRGELKTEQNKGWIYTLQFTHTHFLQRHFTIEVEMFILPCFIFCF